MQDWNPEQLEKMNSDLVNYGSGFLSSRLERLVPSLSAQWGPLFHTLNIESKVLSVIPTLDVSSANYGFVGIVEEEEFAVVVDKEQAGYLSSLLVPNSDSISLDIISEYLARRFISSLSTSWSGVDKDSIKFDSQKEISLVNARAAIKIELSVNNKNINIELQIGEKLLSKLDGLWRRQTSSFNVSQLKYTNLALVLEKINVPVEELNTFLEVGAKIPLEFSGNTPVSITNEDDVISLAKLYNCDSSFGFKILSKAKIPDYKPNMAMLSVVIGDLNLPLEKSGLLTTVGSYISTDLALTNQVSVSLEGKKVASASIMVDGSQYSLIIK